MNYIDTKFIKKDSEILDVGCGSGQLLNILLDIGFVNLTGIDPYIDESIIDDNIKILKKNITEVDDQYDLVLFNHSFEHIPNQLEALTNLSEILKKDGITIIRMPVKTNYIWKRYGVNWVQIDAPRHFCIHTLRSFNLLIKKTPLIVKEIIFDSYEFQFWASEQYKRDIHLKSSNSFSINPESSIFTKKEIIEYKKMAQELNKKSQGDMATFILG